MQIAYAPFAITKLRKVRELATVFFPQNVDNYIKLLIYS